VLVSAIFFPSKTELGLIAESRYNIFLTDTFSQPCDVQNIGRILTSNYLSTYGKMLGRRDACDASRIATAPGLHITSAQGQNT